MSEKRNPAREILLVLGATVVLGGGFALYLVQTIERPTPPKLTPAPAGGDAARPAMLDTADKLFGEFAAHLGSNRYEQAYALMARPYRDAVPLEAFVARCKASTFLASAQRGALLSLRQTSIAGSNAGPYTVQGKGMLVSAAGSIDAAVWLFVENAEPKILVLALAGIPVLEAMSAAKPQ